MVVLLVVVEVVDVPVVVVVLLVVVVVVDVPVVVLVVVPEVVVVVPEHAEQSTNDVLAVTIVPLAGINGPTIIVKQFIPLNIKSPGADNLYTLPFVNVVDDCTKYVLVVPHC